MKELYIVDGYNFLFNYYSTKEVSSEQIEFFRDELLSDLIQYKNYNNCSMMVVFDAKHGDKFAQSRETIDGIKIIYSKGGETADSIVERIVHSNEKYDRIFVITSDYLQQKVVFKENVYRRSIREFAIELSDFKKRITAKVSEQRVKTSHSFYSLENRLEKSTREKLDKMRKNQ
jgi:predicted RNA-binding protein with PIN domain